PLTVELVGPATNKEPAYGYMDTLWEENRPAFLAWMDKAIELYALESSAPETRAEPPYSVAFCSLEQGYLPGFTQALKLQGQNFNLASPQAAILNLALPEGWGAAIDHAATLPALAARQEENGAFSFLFLPESGDWGANQFELSVTPPEDISAEAILEGNLYWKDGDSTIPPQHWLPLPERDFSFNLHLGWNLLALPVTPKLSLSWPPETVFTWGEDKFQNQNQISQNLAFWLWQDEAQAINLSGWHRDDPDESAETPSGWQLRGFTWPQIISGFLHLENSGVMQKISAGLLNPPEAAWIFTP
ncbi:MAG: hypothetical protein WCR92_09445, partial [Candidatus Cloacimonadaceae bacterium]